MLDFIKINPIVTFIYFLSIIMISMFVNNIFLSLVSFFICIIYYKILNIKIENGIIWFNIFTFLTVSILNVLWNHRGDTILLFLNDAPITFESLLYGISFSIVIISSVMWFRLMSSFFTCDKLLYVFSKVSPNVSLILTISIRFVDMYIKKFKEIDDSIKGIGYYKDYSFVDKIKCKTFVFSALVTWALENGIITADSMVARGYGLGKRSSFYIYSFKTFDKIYLFLILLTDMICLIFLFNKSYNINFYPTVSFKFNFFNYLIYYMLLFYGIINEIIWRIKWQIYMSKI